MVTVVATRHRYTYEQVADRIEVELGVRPALSTLRAAAAASSRGTNSRVRVTAGMPAPLSRPVGGRTVFSAPAIDRWLAHHPSRTVTAAMDRLARAGRTAARGAAVVRAREAGLSWQQVADALGTADGTRYSRQWAQQRYGRPTTKSS